MKLIMGLGNPGKEYENTRHNMGFLCLQAFARNHNLSFRKERLYHYCSYQDAVLILPQTYMNNSGEAYTSALSKIGRFDELLVITDDMELKTGDVRIRVSGGDGGHNGLKSIIARRGNNDFPRIRIGIGRPDGEVRDYVLDRISSAERETFDKVLSLLNDWLEVFIRFDLTRLLDEYSKWKRTPIPSGKDGIIRPKEE